MLHVLLMTRLLLCPKSKSLTYTHGSHRVPVLFSLTPFGLENLIGTQVPGLAGFQFWHLLVCPLECR